MAAWCACAEAQMMFSGPNAESPPKKTLGWVDWKVTSSSTGQSHLSNSRPMSRSIHGQWFSWPIAISTWSQGMKTSASPVGS